MICTTLLFTVHTAQTIYELYEPLLLLLTSKLFILTIFRYKSFLHCDYQRSRFCPHKMTS